MRTSRLSSPRIAASWIAILALLLSALAPLVSHALARRDDVGLQVICTTSSSGAPSHDADHLLSHCPCCGALVIALALPPAPIAVAPPQDVLQRVLPLRFLSAARTAHAWSSAQPRGPPRGA